MSFLAQRYILFPKRQGFPDENDKKGGPQKQRPPFMDLIRLILYHPRIANVHIHGFRIANRKNGLSS
jgi:hypothetical protein